MSEKIEFSVKDGKLTVKKEFIEFIKKHIVDYSKIKYQKTLNNFDYFYTIINDNLYKAILSRYDGEIVIIIEQNYNSIFEKGTRLQMLSIEDGDTIYTDKNLALENIDDVEIDFDDKEEKSVDVKGESYWKAEYYQNINGNEYHSKYEKSGNNYFVNDKEVSKDEFNKLMFNHRFKEINKIEDADSLKRREQREKDIKIHKLEKEIEVNNYAISDLNSQIEKLQKQLLKLQEEKDRFIEELNALKN